MNCSLHPHTPAVAECTVCKRPICEVCLVRVNAQPYCEHCAVNRHTQSPFWAAVFSLFVPGLGQFYNGDWFKGTLILLTGWLVLPWVYGIVDAVITAQAIAQGERAAATVPPGYLIFALKIGVLALSCLYIGLVWSIISIGLALAGINGIGNP